MRTRAKRPDLLVQMYWSGQDPRIFSPQRDTEFNGSMAVQSITRPMVDQPEQHESRVLIAVADSALQDRLTTGLTRLGFAIEATTDASEALSLAHSCPLDVLVVDFALLAPSGDRVFTAMCDRPECALIVLTGAHSPPERIIALDAGADDVMSLPLSVAELAMRCEAVLRRAQPSSTGRLPSAASVVQFGPLQLDLGRKQARVRGRDVMATKTELTVLEILCIHPTRVCSRSSMIADLWGPHWTGSGHLLDTHVSNLHRKLRRHAPELRFIRIVRGVGFCLSDELLAAR